MKKVEKFFDPNRESPFFDYMKKVVVGQDVSWARRQWGPKLWGRVTWGTSWGRNIPGAEGGQNVVGQNVVHWGRQRRGAELRGAGRRWGKISGAGGHGAEGSGAGSGSPMKRLWLF